MTADTRRAHGPITNNDEWLEAVTYWTSIALADYMTGKRLTVAQLRFIDTLRSQFGTAPERPRQYLDRLSGVSKCD